MSSDANPDYGVLNTPESMPENTIGFFTNNGNTQVAVVSPDGILRFKVDANDENAQKFIECMESCFQKRITGVDAERVNPVAVP